MYSKRCSLNGHFSITPVEPGFSTECLDFQDINCKYITRNNINDFQSSLKIEADQLPMLHAHTKKRLRKIMQSFITWGEKKKTSIGVRSKSNMKQSIFSIKAIVKLAILQRSWLKTMWKLMVLTQMILSTQIRNKEKADPQKQNLKKKC